MFNVLGDSDIDRLAERFARDGLLRIADFLTDDAATALYDHLRAREDWLQLVNSGDAIVELDRPTRAAMNAEQRRRLDDAIYAQARYAFQYRYESIRVPDDAAARAAADDPVTAFARAMSQGAMRDALRRITAAADIEFADAQATAYAPGDFLTGHDDDFAGKRRRAAYVLSLTPQWREEWGGLLLFHGSGEGTPATAWRPGMNLLTLFAVPMMHSVSEVTRAAAYRRYSITGWLRARETA